jgi:hypothetical protein
VIGLVAAEDQRRAGELVHAALVRSVGAQLVAAGSSSEAIVFTVGDVDIGRVSRSKRVHFGRLPIELRRRLGVVDAEPLDPAGYRAAPAATYHSSESGYAVQYGPRARLLGGKQWRRPLARYDFADEWNNLGYGAITAGSGTWDIGEPVLVAEQLELAAITNQQGRRCASYAALLQTDDEALLWFNRPVGPLDSFEWRLVEVFLSSFGTPDLPIVPVISEIPAGYDTLVSARLDCDEDIESAREIWRAYEEMSTPLSLAIHTRLLEGGAVPPLLREAAERPGAVLAHSATHPANWGGSREAARQEARASADAIERATGQRPTYAVSPFHQTPPYAIGGLVDAGFAGCIGGSISGDPAFNMARSGLPEGIQGGFVGLTGQCMLHGDCMLADDPIGCYREAFDLAFESSTPFVYLDHPFSSRYSYGWRGEDQRIEAHRELVAYIGQRATRPLFLSAGRVMDFVAQRAATTVRPTGDGYEVEAPHGAALQISIDFAGRQHRIDGRIEL